MKKLIIVFFLTIVSCKSNGQDSFEGVIKFSTQINTTDLAPQDFQQQLLDKYGDSLIMYYSKNGDFKRVHLNSAENGADSQFFIAEKGEIYFTQKKGPQIDTLNVTKNSLSLIDKQKIENEKIMGLNCECYEYKAISKYNQNVILNYCYNLESPKIDYELFSKHEDFFLNDYYKMAKRPYLKFSIETEEFKISYSATELLEKKIDMGKFMVK